MIFYTIQIGRWPKDYSVIEQQNLYPFIMMRNMMIIFMMNITSNKDKNNEHLGYNILFKAVKSNQKQ